MLKGKSERRALLRSHLQEGQFHARIQTKKSTGISGALEEGFNRTLRQDVTQAYIPHDQVSVLRRSGSHEPGRSCDIGSLGNQQYSAVLRIFPERLRPVSDAFLNGAVVILARIRSAK